MMNNRASHVLIHTQYTYFIVGKGTECREECHGLSRSRRTTENHWLVLLKPRVEQGFVANCVECWYDDVWRSNVVSLYLDLGYLAVPQRPLPLDGHLRSCDR